VQEEGLRYCKVNYYTIGEGRREEAGRRSSESNVCLVAGWLVCLTLDHGTLLVALGETVLCALEEAQEARVAVLAEAQVLALPERIDQLALVERAVAIRVEHREDGIDHRLAQRDMRHGLDSSSKFVLVKVVLVRREEPQSQRNVLNLHHEPDCLM